MIESGLERMKAVAEMLGVELGEEFDIGESPFNPYEITEDGLLDRNDNATSIALKDLLVGINTITKRPKVPAVDEPAGESCTSEREDYEEANDTLRFGNALMQQEILELKARLYDLLVERIWDKL